MSKALRHQKILDLVRTGGVLNQEQLRSMLAHEGMVVNQSTLSRDIRELELVKGARGYQLASPDAPATAAPKTHLDDAVATYLLSTTPAQNLVVLKTAPGHAQALAVALDRSHLEGILGTLAGDDTVLLVTAEPAVARALHERLLAIARSPA